MNNGALQYLLQMLVGCSHEHETWPMRLPGEGSAHRTCLDCGRRRPHTLLEAQVPLPAKTLGIRHQLQAGIAAAALPHCGEAAKRRTVLAA